MVIGRPTQPMPDEPVDPGFEVPPPRDDDDEDGEENEFETDFSTVVQVAFNIPAVGADVVAAGTSNANFFVGNIVRFNDANPMRVTGVVGFQGVRCINDGGATPGTNIPIGTVMSRSVIPLTGGAAINGAGIYRCERGHRLLGMLVQKAVNPPGCPYCNSRVERLA